MKRQPLLIETLLKRRISRAGGVYSYRPSVGPPAVSDQRIDKFLHAANQQYDMGPILKGDLQQAKQIALDYLNYIKEQSSKAKLPEDEVLSRLKESMPHIRRSLLTFYTYLDAKVKSMS